MKKVLILVLSSDFPPYQEMIETSRNTWDAVEVDGVETVFYCAVSEKRDTDKVIYLPIDNSLQSVGQKTILALEWALRNKQFDYLARPNASCFVNKKELVKYIQTLPDNNVFAGLKVDTDPPWIWGGGQILMSKDVVEKVIAHKQYWKQTEMEDVALSYLINRLEIPYTNGRACSIDKTENGWRCMAYGCEGFEFTDWSDLKKLDNQFFFRCKQDGHRYMEKFIMEEMYKVLI